MIKKVYAISMTYDVSDAEKQQAERALLCFEHTIKKLDKSSEYLNKLKTPFKDNPEISEEEIYNTRADLRKFRDISIDNFNEFKDLAFKCVNIMQMFSFDTQIIKMMKSFISSVDELEIVVNNFVDLFKDLKSKDFAKNIVEIIENIQKQCNSIKEIADERIVNHIETNILARNWVDIISNKLQTPIEKTKPLLLDLYNKRQNLLNDKMKENK